MLLAATLSFACPAQAADVLLLLSARAGPYAEAADALRARLEASGAGLDVHIAEAADAPELSPFAAIAAIGSAASEFVASRAQAPPSIHVLIPSSSYLALPAAVRARSSAVFVDQPASRQIALLRAALPGWRRLALLYGDATSGLAERITEAASQQQMKVASAFVADRAVLYPAIQQLLDEPAILLALPDPAVFNSYTVQNVLLSAYRERSPVIGFSAAFVRAGALLAIYAEPASIGRQAAALLLSATTGAPLPPPEYPGDFEVAANVRVARSLNIDLPTPETLRAAILKMESSR